jgi:hypothetical protein
MNAAGCFQVKLSIVMSKQSSPRPPCLAVDRYSLAVLTRYPNRRGHEPTTHKLCAIMNKVDPSLQRHTALSSQVLHSVSKRPRRSLVVARPI